MRYHFSILHGFILKIREWIKKIREWIKKIREWINPLHRHLESFWPVWIIFIAFLIITVIYRLIPGLSDSVYWSIVKWISFIGIAAITILLIKKPMNVVYGLMGTTGSITTFMSNFILITLIFACIYQWGFFHNARVSYDVNQPHVYYNYSDTKVCEVRDTTYYVRMVDTIEQRDTVIQLIHYDYQPISFGQTWRNTILTTLMQEPTDFFAVASTYNEKMDKNIDKDKAATFHWLLIIQILISWIFFGVFISILYNKFRYES